LPWVHFFGSWRRPMARCQSLCHFFIAPTVFTAASSLGTSWCSDSDSFFFGIGLQIPGFHFYQASLNFCFHWFLADLYPGLRPFG
jgi:hypothetical protein